MFESNRLAQLLVLAVLVTIPTGCFAQEGPPGEGPPALLTVKSETVADQGMPGRGGAASMASEAANAMFDWITMDGGMFGGSWFVVQMLALNADRKALLELMLKKTGLNLEAFLRRCGLSGRALDTAVALSKLDKQVLTADEVARDFRNAIWKYVLSHGPVHDSSNVFDVRATAEFLEQHTTVVSQNVWRRFVTGSEAELWRRIPAESARLGRKLSPGDVYAIALELDRGDKFKAVLTCHNTLRNLGRGDKQDKAFIPEVKQDTAFFPAHLQPIRGGGDESGAWYHFFVLAAATMTAGPQAAAGAILKEELGVSGDFMGDPMEVYIDSLGIAAGVAISRNPLF